MPSLKIDILSVATIACLGFFSCHTDAPLQQLTYKRVKCNFSAYRIRNLCEDEKRYLDWAANYKQEIQLSSLTKERLLRLTRSTKDVDYAAALFYQRVIHDPKNHAFLAKIDQTEQFLINKKIRPDTRPKNILFALVPGMFYQDNKQLQAKGNAIRHVVRSLGLTDKTIPISQSDPVSKNAKQICSFLKKQIKFNSIILASVSKGSADVKIAIKNCKDKAYFKKVKAWLNIGGILRGSPLINDITDDFYNSIKGRWYFFWHGYSWAGLYSLRYGKQEVLYSPLEPPKNLLIVNIVGVPLFRHVTARARPYYIRLVHDGPNDGMVLLADSYVRNTYIFPVFRSDHYFQYPITQYKMYSIINYITQESMGIALLHK